MYVTDPNAAASSTRIEPVVLKPWDTERVMMTGRTRIGGLPG